MEISPERIIAIFEKLPRRPVSLNEVLENLGATAAYRHMVLNLMRALSRDGVLIRLRNKHFALPEPAEKVSGIIHVSEKGTGFILGVAAEGADLYVHRSNLLTAVDGDRVEAEVFDGPRGKREGRITAIVERAHEWVVGQFAKTGAGGTITPRNVKIQRWIFVRKIPAGMTIPEGAWVRAHITEWTSDVESPLVGEIEEIIGLAGDRGVSVLVLLRDLGVDPAFPPEVEQQVAQFKHIEPQDHPTRLDLREENVFTIDPATAKDFDDALSVKRLSGGNFELGVHIADVAQYVTPGTALDGEAFKRGTSIYPVDRVVPMLPERLSNDLCSLRPAEERFTLSAIMEINPSGVVEKYEIRESIIRSRHRLNYDEVQAFIDAAPEKRQEYRFADIEADLMAVRDVARVLNEMRMRRGALDLDLPEIEVDCNLEGDAIGLHRHGRFESHRLVEECMLIANEVVAEHLRKQRLPCLYRIHDVPDPWALQKQAPALMLFGVKIPKKVSPTPEFYQPIVDKLRRIDGGHIGQRLVLRTLMRAVYSPENHGHFGLASKCYCHFTSPIRRYPDLLVHRVLKTWLRGEADEKWREALDGNLIAISNQSNRTADRSMDIEMQAVRIKSMEFMKDNEGGIFEGWISGITRNGFFVELVDLPVEGFVRIQSLPGDMFDPDENFIRMIGRATCRVYQLAQRIQVRVVRVNELEAQMDLELAEKAKGREKGKKKKKGK